MSDQITTMTNDAVTILSATECWELLKSVTLGRIVTTVDNTSHIFPINFVVHRRTVLFRTAEGTKLVSAAINNNVVFEADDHDVAAGWSVIVRGVARTVRDTEDLAECERAGLLPWTATTKNHWVRVLPTQITGRRFRFGPEPVCRP
ncbi:pyridoxamine 5'-phosphate oxidase family protein [Mycolicibacterium goodii]|uniref:Pyridoxamine 5'-phosphate oxidase family protein n=1 Tax=Mycolicibacterium goodii TaxID=134601 RepID=A0ABS6HNX2_MYCGD|nr:pyridoxamine 5'-phosphate oxidase family protein [Mycolicibacterium goodii]MBU8818265.1 pyridoxamine 5'-phosphate oxidase family protein [Mycolicibacterium goodii]MBU8823389.1 pyridoxamine 5'-phosphate oxidase family protein [Mycolicibacterium goodii]MBU8835562.1 pyridoxamine 5'-phosphate oxidase family protein [Mycolicibacterium goodii]OKH62579.1 pyridoxamine 5'-phosphate oxidase [Mycobacterium sp. SWH-M5]